MEPNPLDSLTPKERECLRLVAPDRKSAVIAATLGIAVPTVETHLRSARAKLGGVSRFTAARLLKEHEARQSLTSRGLTIAEPMEPAVVDASDQPIAAGSQPLMMGDARPAFEKVSARHVTEQATAGRTRLSALNRMALIAFCLLALVVAGIASIPLSAAVQDVARMVMKQRTE
ncbi:helix-turn-helix domain-containing protein [Sphingomonas sp. RIT328]|uniref:helix-turn-helix domain-containing protein n=1 Tax=Sphingomonas sp. RIT328 TaxID=1470591 RepID=UPI000445258F|nr:helix-turn-helix transcriptional regulator [Sphingomonas sp. RIT328]EZP49957.1 Regulatory protein, LuxR [Sphingomonas sp. RIT328]